MPVRRPRQPRGDQRWSTFLKNHAKAILACDFFIAVTATFRMLYVFVVIEHSTRRLAHINVTAHPNADWTLQQLREVVGNGGGHRYVIHDRDRIFAKHLDDSIRALGVEVLRSPVASPKANAICERVIGTARRECLDWLIPVSGRSHPLRLCHLDHRSPQGQQPARCRCGLRSACHAICGPRRANRQGLREIGSAREAAFTRVDICLETYRISKAPNTSATVRSRLW